MAFVHEMGSAAEQQQVAEEAKSLREDFLPGNEEWAIDRERDAHLVCFSTGRRKEGGAFRWRDNYFDKHRSGRAGI